MHCLVGAANQSASGSIAKKRDVKAKSKQEPEQSDDMLLRVNLNKFLADERKLSVIKMAHRKLRHATDESLLKVYETLVELDAENYL